MRSIEEEVIKYCYSRNLCLVTKEGLEYRNRPIVIEKMNKDAIPIEWVRKYMDSLPDGSMAYECILVMLERWEKENGK